MLMLNLEHPSQPVEPSVDPVETFLHPCSQISNLHCQFFIRHAGIIGMTECRVQPHGISRSTLRNVDAIPSAIAGVIPWSDPWGRIQL